MIANIVAVTIPLLALSLHASPFEIGLLATSRGVVYFVWTFVAGYALARHDRRRVLLLATMLDLAAALLFYLSRVPSELIVLRALEGLAMATFWPTLESLIAKIRTSRESGDALRGFNISWGLGQMIGPIIAGSVIMFFDVRKPFLVAASFAILNMILILRYKSASHMVDQNKRPVASLGGMPAKLILTVAFLGGIASVFFAFFPVFAVTLEISALELGILLFLFGLTRVLIFHRALSIQARPYSRMLLASLGFLMVYVGNRFLMYVGVVVLAAGLSLLYAYTLDQVLRGDDLSVRRRAGVFEGLLGVGSMVGPFLAGFVAEFSFAYTFMAVALASLLFAAVLKLLEIHSARAYSC